MVIDKTFIMWNDVFCSCYCGGEESWSILPQWRDQILEIKQYKGKL